MILILYIISDSAGHVFRLLPQPLNHGSAGYHEPVPLQRQHAAFFVLLKKVFDQQDCAGACTSISSGTATLLSGSSTDHVQSVTDVG